MSFGGMTAIQARELQMRSERRPSQTTVNALVDESDMKTYKTTEEMFKDIVVSRNAVPAREFVSLAVMKNRKQDTKDKDFEFDPVKVEAWQ